MSGGRERLSETMEKAVRQAKAQAPLPGNTKAPRPRQNKHYHPDEGPPELRWTLGRTSGSGSASKSARRAQLVAKEGDSEDEMLISQSPSPPKASSPALHRSAQRARQIPSPDKARNAVAGLDAARQRDTSARAFSAGINAATASTSTIPLQAASREKRQRVEAAALLSASVRQARQYEAEQRDLPAERLPTNSRRDHGRSEDGQRTAANGKRSASQLAPPSPDYTPVRRIRRKREHPGPAEKHHGRNVNPSTAGQDRDVIEESSPEAATGKEEASRHDGDTAWQDVADDLSQAIFSRERNGKRSRMQSPVDRNQPMVDPDSLADRRTHPQSGAGQSTEPESRYYRRVKREAPEETLPQEMAPTPDSMPAHVQLGDPSSPRTTKQVTRTDRQQQSLSARPLPDLPAAPLDVFFTDACRPALTGQVRASTAAIFADLGVNTREELHVLASMQREGQDWWFGNAREKGLSALWEGVIRCGLATLVQQEMK